MKTVIAALWLILVLAFAIPVIETYLSGIDSDGIIQSIQREAESDEIDIMAHEAHGNKEIYAFTAGAYYGAAIFSRFSGHYQYEEGIVTDFDSHIDVNLDTGWDIYEYEITASGMEITAVREGDGIYSTYAKTAGILAVITMIAGIYSRAKRRRKEKNGKKFSEDI